MIKKLTKHGNSTALVIDRSIMELLKINADDQVEISTDGNVLIISPIRDESREAKMRTAREKVSKRFANVMKQLADANG